MHIPHTRTDTASTGGGGDPVGLAEAVRLVLVAVVAGGWIAIPDTVVNIVVSAVGVIGSILSTVLARRKVVPLAALRAPAARSEPDDPLAALDPLYAEDVPRAPDDTSGT